MSGSSPSDSGNSSNPPRPEGSLPIDDNSHSQAENLHAASSNEEGQSIVPGRIPASPNQHEVGEIPEANAQDAELAALIAEERRIQDQIRRLQEEDQRVQHAIYAITLKRQRLRQLNQANNASINSNNNNNAANAELNDSVANESDAPRSEQSAHNVTEGSQSHDSDDHQMNESESSGNIGNEGNDGGN